MSALQEEKSSYITARFLKAAEGLTSSSLRQNDRFQARSNGVFFVSKYLLDVSDLDQYTSCIENLIEIDDRTSIDSKENDQPILAFAKQAVLLEKRGKPDAALDLIYNTIDDMLLAENFDECNKILANVDPDKLSTRLILGILTITWPSHESLPAREKLCRDTRAVLIKRKEDADALLLGIKA